MRPVHLRSPIVLVLGAMLVGGPADRAHAAAPVESTGEINASAKPIAKPATVTSVNQVSTSASAPKSPPTINAVSQVNASMPAPVAKTKAKSLATTPTLSKKLRQALASRKLLPSAVKLDILTDAGISGHAGVGGVTQLTVRDPYAGSNAFLVFVGAAVVNPAEGGRGTASIDGDLRVAGAVPSSGFGNPFAGLLPGALQPPRDNALLVDFRALPDTHYLVECTWASPEPPPSTTSPWTPVAASDFYSQVRDGGTAVEGGLAVRDGMLVQVVPAQSSARRVVVKFKADRRFLASACAITPVGSG